MRIYLSGVLILPILVVLGFAADPSLQYSNPSLPPREALDRMNLHMPWFANVPMDGNKDGFLDIELDGKQVLFQTRSGLVGAVDAENGRILWWNLPGKPYRTAIPMAYNMFSLYVFNNTDLYSLDRRSGKEQWRFRLSGGLSAAPIADDEQIYFPGSGGQVFAMRVPKYDFSGNLISAELEARILGGYTIPNALKPEDANSPQPLLSWEMQTYQLLEFRPVMTKEMIMVSGNVPSSRTGRVLGFAKFPSKSIPTELLNFPLDHLLTVAPTAYESTVYVGSADANLFAVNINSGRSEWRFTTGEPISSQPIATEKDVFISTFRNGMARIDREKGTGAWQVPVGKGVSEFNNEADRYLASNPKYVYARDRAGRLLVLDRLQGKTLSRYALIDYYFPVVNQQTDRLFLAANNGLIVCLHDKEYTQPLQHRKTFSEAETIRVKLARLISQPAVDKVAFKTFVTDFAKAHDLKLEISTRAFMDVGKFDTPLKPVSLPAINNRPVMEILQQVLDQIDGTSIVVRDTVLIAPRGRNAPPMPMPMPMPNP